MDLELGFLPGDLQQKVDPYLRPLYDALFDMMEWFLNNLHEVKLMSSNAREMIVSRYDRQAIWQEILKVYNSLT